MIDKTYDCIFSIGGSCRAAYNLIDSSLRDAAGPFDWLITPDMEMVFQMLETHFRGFFQRENLEVKRVLSNKKLEVLDKATGFLFMHDFYEAHDFEADYQEARERYDRRIERFYRSIAEAGSCLFVRADNQRSEAGGFSRLKCLNPDAKLDVLLVRDRAQEAITQEVFYPNENITVWETVISNQPDTPEKAWRGNTRQWKEILRNVKLKKNSFLETIRQNSAGKKLVIWGAGSCARNFIPMFLENQFEIAFIVDRDPAKTGTQMDRTDLRIFKPAILEGKSEEVYVVILVSVEIESIFEKLERWGYARNCYCRLSIE